MKEDLTRPMATYRLQFNQDFRLTDAQALVPYFSRLGITHCYASPLLRARQGSSHGYDVVDPAMINPNLGDKTDLVSFVSTLHNFGLGLVLDIVPNHMAASIENPYWRDVLTYGPSSPFASWFDIDWRMPDPNMWGRVLVPVLGAPRSRVLAEDQIRLDWSDGRFLVRYFDHTFPVDPATVPSICQFGLEDLRQRLAADHPVLDQIREILDKLMQLPKSATRLRRHVEIDREETEGELAKFAHLVVQSPTIEQWARETAQRFGEGKAGHARLRKLLDAQSYRLVHWRDAARTINYRRFFDINELVSVRQEDPQVFEDTHLTIFRWVDEGLLDGLRIDHIDGLRDPLGYLERLIEALTRGERGERPRPVFVEKILAPQEKLPCGWPVAGTTGYEFLNQLEAVFLSPDGFEVIEHDYRRWLRRSVDFEQVARWGKRRILKHDLSPQVGRLADLLWRLAEQRRYDPPAVAAESQGAEAASASAPEHDLAADYGPEGTPTAVAGRRELTKRELLEALVEVMITLPVYRTYVDRNHGIISDADREYLEEALQEASAGGRATPEAMDFLREVLLLENRAQCTEHEINERLNFIERFQQLTGPAAAKGIEDTALYAYVPLVSLNEVGGEPRLTADDPLARLHETNGERAATWPQTMLSVTTHDTKRTADVRARLDVLSELPKTWDNLCRRWRRINRSLASQVGGKRAPEPAAESLIYQTIVGLWPAPGPLHASDLPDAEVLGGLHERIETYTMKAVREAKTRTSWTNQNQDYEEALVSFLRGLFHLDHQGQSTFLTEVQALVAQIARPGFWNSLSRTLVQFTAPGTPDLYQGDELWNFAMVDPDNRRPVDYEARQKLLDDVIRHVEEPDESRRAFLESLVQSPEDGRIKLHVIHAALAVRHSCPHLFAGGQYVPLLAEGAAKQHLIAFARLGRISAEGEAPDAAAVIIVPRLTTSLTSRSAAAPVGEAVWSDTILRLPEPLRNRVWKCALTGASLPPADEGVLRAAQALEFFPAGLLIGKRS